MSNNVDFVSPADKLAKKMLTDLSCVSCKSFGLRSDGSAKGRLRLVCNGCRKTIYVDTYPRVICEMRTKSDGKQLCLSTGPKSVKSMQVYQKSIHSDPMQVYHHHCQGSDSLLKSEVRTNRKSSEHSRRFYYNLSHNWFL